MALRASELRNWQAEPVIQTLGRIRFGRPFLRGRTGIAVRPMQLAGYGVKEEKGARDTSPILHGLTVAPV